MDPRVEPEDDKNETPVGDKDLSVTPDLIRNPVCLSVFPDLIRNPACLSVIPDLIRNPWLAGVDPRVEPEDDKNETPVGDRDMSVIPDLIRNPCLLMSIKQA
jgi:hypothetical protein